MLVLIFYPLPFEGIPVLARVGTADAVVSPYFTRRMVRLLKEIGGTTLVLRKHYYSHST